MEGRTTANFRCPCTDVSAPPGHSFWVELVGLPGFPALLHGTCHRCDDKWVGLTSQVLVWYDVHRWLGGVVGAVVGGAVRATWELEDLTQEEVEECQKLTQEVAGGAESQFW